MRKEEANSSSNCAGGDKIGQLCTCVSGVAECRGGTPEQVTDDKVKASASDG